MIRRGIFIGLCVLLLSLVVVPSIRAQIFEIPEGQRAQYRQQLETYRTAEHTFTIAKEQYEKLQTLVSLEDAVRSTQQGMLARVTVLQSFMEMTRLQLEQTSGIDLTTKDTQLKQDDSVIEKLKAHRLAVEASNDRTKILQVALEYLTLSAEVNDAGYHSLAMINYGQLQTIYDKTIAIRDDVTATVEQNEKNPLVLSEKRRALDEINRSVETVNTQLVDAREDLKPSKSSARSFYSRSRYNSYVDNLSDIYGNLSRNLDYLQEIMKGSN